MQPGAFIDLFNFVKRIALPGVMSGKLTRTDDGYIISVDKGGSTYSYVHDGPMQKDDLLEVIDQIKQNLDYSKLTNADRRSLGMPIKRPRSVTEGGQLRLRKASNRIKAVVSEQNGGFTITGVDTDDNVAGDINGKHWVKVTWTPDEYDIYNLSPKDKQFVTDHTAAIAYKTEPGAEPQIDFYNNNKIAQDRFDMLLAKHGTPKDKIMQNKDINTTRPANLSDVDNTTA